MRAVNESQFIYNDINEFKTFLNNLLIDEDFQSSSDLLKGAILDLPRVYEKVSNMYSGISPILFELEFTEDTTNDDYSVEYIVFHLQGDEFVKQNINTTLHMIDSDLKRYRGSTKIKYTKFEIKKTAKTCAKLFFMIDN